MTDPIIECEGLVHIYRTAQLEVVALQGLDLRVEPGEVVAIVGRSGSGKTTLMNVIAAVEEPTAGRALVGGHDLTRMSERERNRFRQPQVLLADEPTAELDRATADHVLRDLRQLLRESGSAAVIVTHDASVERHADRVIQIRDGRTSTETRWLEQAGEVVADELLIMDRAGRIQLPRAYVERLGARGLIRAHLEGDEIRLRRGDQEQPDE